MVGLLLVARLAARPRDHVLHPLPRPRAPGPVLLVVVVARDVEIHLDDSLQSKAAQGEFNSSAAED